MLLSYANSFWWWHRCAGDQQKTKGLVCEFENGELQRYGYDCARKEAFWLAEAGVGLLITAASTEKWQKLHNIILRAWLLGGSCVYLEMRQWTLIGRTSRCPQCACIFVSIPADRWARSSKQESSLVTLIILQSRDRAGHQQTFIVNAVLLMCIYCITKLCC